MTMIICNRCRQELSSDDQMRWHSNCVRTLEIRGVITDQTGDVDSIVASNGGAK